MGTETYRYFNNIGFYLSGSDIPRYGDGNISLERIISGVMSGRDIPRYGDGNNFKLIIETLLSGRDIPRYGDGNYQSEPEDSCLVRKGHPQIWGRKLFNNFFLWVFVRKGHPRAADNNIFELKRLAKKIKCKREMGFLN